MTRTLWLFAVLTACSVAPKGIGDDDVTLPGTPNTTTGSATGTTTGTATGTPTGTTTGSTATCTTQTPSAGTVPALPACEYVPTPAGTVFEARVEWAMTQEMVDPSTGVLIPEYLWAEYPGYGSVYQAPAVRSLTDDDGDGSIDDDDIPDIAAVMAHPSDVLDGVLRLISGDGARVHDSLGWAPHTNANGTFDYAPYHYAGVAIGDVDGDGNVEIATLVIRSDNLCYPATYQVNRTGSTATLSLEKVYAGANYNCGAHAPALADLDDDGEIELIYGRAVFRGDLTQKWYGTGGRGWYGRDDYPYPDGYWNSGYHPIPWDVDGDGSQLEVIAGRTIYRSNGTTFCELGWYQGLTWVNATDGYPAVGDLLRFPGDIEGEPEVVITGNGWVRVFHGVPDYDPNGLARCVMIDEAPNSPEDDAELPVGLPIYPNCDPYAASFGGPATVADFNGDGDREIAVAGGCWYSVFQLDGGDLDRFAVTQTKDWSSASTGSTVFDFNGDGSSEVVFSDELALYVWGVDTAPGLLPWQRLVTYLEDTEHKSWTIHEYPLVADVDGDGKAEILAVNSHLPGYEGHFGIYALGAVDGDWVSARDIWNQHAYSVTNVADDGDIGYVAPNYAPYTAADYNSFRNQAPGTFGALAAPNLYPEVTTCQDGCGDVTVWVQVANEGEFIAVGSDLVVSLYGVTAAGTRTLIGDAQPPSFVLPMTVSDPIEFTVSGWNSYVRLEAVVDDPDLGGLPGGTGVAKECDELDNVLSVSLAGLCP